MIDKTWIASKSLAQMLLAVAQAVRGWIACAAHSLEAVWFLALSITSYLVPSCHVDAMAAGARGHCLSGDAVRPPA